MRRAMPGIVVLLLAGHAAHAASYRIVSAVTACIDPAATLVLGDAALIARRPAAWRAAVEQRGQCVTIRPGADWERILSTGPLILLRRTPPQPGLPPLYFRNGTVTSVQDPVPGMVAAGTTDPLAPVAAADDRIATEPLPPVAAASQSTRPETPPMPAAQGNPDSTLMDVAANPSNLDRAMQQGYVVGFVAAMLLLVLLVMVIAGIIWTILRTRLFRDVGMPGFTPQITSGLSPALAAGAGTPTLTRRVVLTEERPAAGMATASAQQLSTPGLALPPVVPPPPVDASDYRRHCIAMLDAAGWQTSVREVDGKDTPDLVAERDGRVMALQCLPMEPAVDEDAIDCACMARERQRADIAAVVTNASFTGSAKRLALQTGVVLLHADELASFAA